MLLVLLIAVGVLGVLALRSVYYGPAEGIAARIEEAHSPIVRYVDLAGPNLFYGGGSRISVYVSAGVTDAEVRAMWCQVVVVAGAGALKPDDLHILRGDRFNPTLWIPDVACR